MPIDLSDLSNRLTNQDEAFKIVYSVMSNMLFPKPLDYIDENLYLYLIGTYARDNIDFIFSSSSSPVERIFLSSILISALSKGAFFLTMGPPLRSVTKALEQTRSSFVATLQAWQDFQKNTGNYTMSAFLEFINQLPIDENIKIIIQRDMCLYIYQFHNTFFLSLKSSIEEVKFNGEKIDTDIFIWTIGEPNFRLLVECDEHDYLTQRHSFSNDRARDRLVQSKGFQVLRFSSSEIMSNPLGKANELVRYLSAYADNFKFVS